MPTQEQLAKQITSQIIAALESPATCRRGDVRGGSARTPGHPPTSSASEVTGA